MKANVDLTLNREFISTKERQIRRRERCEECGEPIRIPWKDYCLRCERALKSIGFFKTRCYLQLGYPRPSKGEKNPCRRQLNDPKYFTIGRKKSCRRQLGDPNFYKPRKVLCRIQLRNHII